MGAANGLAQKSMFPDELALGNYQGESAPASQPAVSEETLPEVKVAFEELFERYHSMVFHLTYRLLGDREEALDVSQEVFLTVYRKLGRFRGESSLKTWIYRIAINRASNRCRWWNRLRRRGTVSLDFSSDHGRGLSETLEAVGRSPEEALLLEEERAQIEQSLLKLPVQQRIARFLLLSNPFHMLLPMKEAPNDGRFRLELRVLRYPENN